MSENRRKVERFRLLITVRQDDGSVLTLRQDTVTKADFLLWVEHWSARLSKELDESFDIYSGGAGLWMEHARSSDFEYPKGRTVVLRDIERIAI